MYRLIKTPTNPPQFSVHEVELIDGVWKKMMPYEVSLWANSRSGVMDIIIASVKAFHLPVLVEKDGVLEEAE